ncbi:branched-chain amino acid ABC transporter permease [Agromyces sp. SYSU T00194]|uniref:branched-chain amino acid ABC transporter permease n=1 Tax=Agromyces chitinivorans TaxID=3158560 RepID=UPI0033945AE3
MTTPTLLDPAARRRRAIGWATSAVLLVLAVLFPVLADSNYLVAVASLALTYMVIAQSLNLVFGYAGFFALGITVPWVVGGYVTAVLTRTHEWETVPALLAGAVGGALVMALFGLATLGRGRNSFAILSLVLMLFVEILVRTWTEVTGGGAGIANLPVIDLGFTDIVTPTEFYYFTLAVVALIMLAMWAMVSSRWGRTLRATKGDELLAASMGVSLLHHRVLVLAIASAFCGLVGGIHVLRISVAVPSMAGLEYLAPLLAIIFIGGPGNFLGVVMASVVVTFIPELARGFDEWRQFIYGGLLVVLCLLFPLGIPARFTQLVGAWRARRAARPGHGSDAAETTDPSTEPTAPVDAEKELVR